jgi:hypothetical protein
MVGMNDSVVAQAERCCSKTAPVWLRPQGFLIVLFARCGHGGAIRNNNGCGADEEKWRWLDETAGIPHCIVR